MPRLECLAPPAPVDHKQALVHLGPTVIVTVQAPVIEQDKPPASEAVAALIDTGATESHIDEALAKQLKLPIIDQQKLAGVGGVVNHDVVLGTILVAELGTSISGRFVCVRLADGQQLHRVILGRTFLADCVMIYDGVRGQVTLMK